MGNFGCKNDDAHNEHSDSQIPQTIKNNRSTTIEEKKTLKADTNTSVAEVTIKDWSSFEKLQYGTEIIWYTPEETKIFLDAIILYCPRRGFDFQSKYHFIINPFEGTLEIKVHCWFKSSYYGEQKHVIHRHVKSIPYMNYNCPHIYSTCEYPCNIRIAHFTWWNSNLLTNLEQCLKSKQAKWNLLLELIHSDVPLWLTEEDTKNELDEYNVDFDFTVDPEKGLLTLTSIDNAKNVIITPYSSYYIPCEHTFGRNYLGLAKSEVPGWMNFCPLGIRIPRKDLRSEKILNSWLNLEITKRYYIDQFIKHKDCAPLVIVYLSSL
jgi:hypothetical protein